MRLAVLGCNGFVGRNLIRHLNYLGLHPTPLSRPFRYETADYNIIINTAGYKEILGCDKNMNRAVDDNVRLLFQLSQTPGKIIHISTDYVFNDSQTPKNENTVPNPNTTYGITKLAGEILLGKAKKDHLIIRTGGLYDKDHWLMTDCMIKIRNNIKVEAFDDVVNTPTYIGSLAKYLIYAMSKNITGIRHYSDAETLSRYGLMKKIAKKMLLDDNLIIRCKKPAHVNIPRDLSLSSIYDYPRRCVDQSVSALLEGAP